MATEARETVDLIGSDKVEGSQIAISINIVSSTRYGRRYLRETRVSVRSDVTQRFLTPKISRILSESPLVRRCLTARPWIVWRFLARSHTLPSSSESAAARCARTVAAH